MWIGLNAAGVHTIDFGTTIPAVLRYGVRAYSTIWAFILVHNNTEMLLQLLMLDHKGIPISKKYLREKIESAYWHEDFVQAAPDKIGSHRHLPVVTDDYIAALREK